jgi:hypothetical protein
MNLLSNLWATRPIVVILVVLVVIIMLFGRTGTNLLARWLGLTDKNAQRLTGLVTVLLWAVLILLMSGFGSTGWDLSNSVATGRGFAIQSWWIILLFVVVFVWKRLR